MCLTNPLQPLEELGSELQCYGLTLLGRGRPVVGETCHVQCSWVGVLTPCVTDWSDCSCDYCKRLSKGERLFPSHKGNNQIGSMLSLSSVCQNILLIQELEPNGEFSDSLPCVRLYDSSSSLILWGCFSLTSSALLKLIFVSDQFSTREKAEINNFLVTIFQVFT